MKTVSNQVLSSTTLLPNSHPERSKLSAKLAICEVEGPLRSLAVLRSRITAATDLAAAILREIFDESAYDRFLDRHNLRSSPSSYAKFRTEHENAKAYRPRCC